MLDEATEAFRPFHAPSCFGRFRLDRLIGGFMSDWRYVESNRQETRNVDLYPQVPHVRPAAQGQL